MGLGGSHVLVSCLSCDKQSVLGECIVEGIPDFSGTAASNEDTRRPPRIDNDELTIPGTADEVEIVSDCEHEEVTVFAGLKPSEELPQPRSGSAWSQGACDKTTSAKVATPCASLGTPTTFAGTSACSPRTCVSTPTTTSSSMRKTDLVVKQYRETRDARDRVRVFLSRHGFQGVNAKRQRLLRSSYPLHCAVKHNDAEVVRLLLLWGADPTREDCFKRTPYQEALRRDSKGSHRKVIQLLKSAGGDETRRHHSDAFCMTGFVPETLNTQVPHWESFIQQLANDPLVSRRRLADIMQSTAT